MAGTVLPTLVNKSTFGKGGPPLAPDQEAMLAIHPRLTLALHVRWRDVCRMTESFCVSNARDMFGRCSTRESHLPLLPSPLCPPIPSFLPLHTLWSPPPPMGRGADRCGPLHQTSARDSRMIAYSPLQPRGLPLSTSAMRGGGPKMTDFADK